MGIFIDFSKAFDTIQHNILLDKLYHYGVRGIAHTLISSYLNNRKQFVYYDNECYSALEDINVGVPQGSVLGLYFSYSMSMTLSVVQKCQLNSYCLRTIQTYLYMLQHLKNYTAKQTKYFGK